MEGIPNARDEICAQENQRYQSSSDETEPDIGLSQRAGPGEQKAVEVEPQRVENNREDKHEMGCIANADCVIEERTVGDSKVGVKVCEDIVEGCVSEEEETEETDGYVDCGAESK